MSTALFPQPVEVPKPKKKRASWSQAQVAELVRRHVETSAEERGAYTAEAHAKLVELGIIPKPEKPSLTTKQKEAVGEALADILLLEPEVESRVVVRYAIKQLTALLPKRAPK